ncbi:UBP36-like protein [Mya arenaria]|uniref:Ubiquitin carboxyl-terminal hydrolase 36 n=1 Tax=Mya arenaria TaxID=6604 RepID=A0ABY7DN21_MYAAR|nr:UBP36-like protein [Mya arenaria]
MTSVIDESPRILISIALAIAANTTPHDDGEGLPQPKVILFPLEKLDFSWHQQRAGCGFQNCGNTCFLNATMQCLVHCPPLTNYMMSGEHQATCRAVNQDRCILCNLQFLTKRGVHGVADSITPKWFVNNLQYIGRHFRIGRQEDAHEFLRLSLEKMMKCAVGGYHEKLDKYSKDTTVIHQIYAGYLRSQVVCSRCEYKSNTYDPLLDISLDIKNADNLERAFHQFVAPDKLDMENAYKCDKCKQKVMATKRFTIHKAPNVLTIQLKRFQYAVGGGGFYGSGIGGKINKMGPPETYSLLATIQHEGYSSQSGHYVSNVRVGRDWYHYNDSTKRLTSLQRCLNEPSAYILFYMKDSAVLASRSSQNLTKVVRQPSMTSVIGSGSNVPSTDIGKPVKSPLAPLSSNREKIRISLGVKPLNKTPEQAKPTVKSGQTTPSNPRLTPAATPTKSGDKPNAPPTPKLVMKIQNGKAITIETSPNGVRRILSDDDEVVSKMNEKKQRKHKKRSSLVPYGDDSTSDSDCSKGTSSHVNGIARKRRLDSTEDKSLPTSPKLKFVENQNGAHPLHEHNYGIKDKNGILFDKSLNTTTSVPGNAHLMETITMKDRLSHAHPDRSRDLKNTSQKNSTPVRKNLAESLSCNTTANAAKHAGATEWTTVIESVKSPVGSSHSNCSVQSGHSTSEWSVTKNKLLHNGHSNDGWTVTPNKDDAVKTSGSQTCVSGDVKKAKYDYATTDSYSSPFLIDNGTSCLLNAEQEKDKTSEENRLYKKAKKHKKHKKHKHEDRDRQHKYSELDESPTNSHKKKKKKKKHKHRAEDRDDDTSIHISQEVSPERREVEKHQQRDEAGEPNREEELERTHRQKGEKGQKRRMDDEEDSPAKRSRQDSESSPEYEWVEKSVPVRRLSQSVPGSPPPSQKWDHHVKDGYKRPALSGSSTPLKSHWDGLKHSKVVSQLEDIAKYGYGAPVSGWDGGRSHMDMEKNRSSTWRQDSDDEYDEEFDQGRVKKWSTMKVGDNNRFFPQNNGHSTSNTHLHY